MTPYSGALGEYNWDRRNQEEASNIRSQYYINVYRYLDRDDARHVSSDIRFIL